MIAGMNVQQKLDTGIPVLFYLSKIYVRQIHQGRMLIARLRFYFFHLNLKRRLWLRSVGMTLLFRVFPCRILGSKPLNSFFILELIFSWDA